MNISFVELNILKNWFVMVRLSGVQFGLWSYEWWQNRTKVQLSSFLDMFSKKHFVSCRKDTSRKDTSSCTLEKKNNEKNSQRTWLKLKRRTSLSFFGLFCHPPSEEANKMWTSFTTSRCSVCKGQKCYEKYPDNYFACVFFCPWLCIIFARLFKSST